jgi:hypothetical protein
LLEHCNAGLTLRIIFNIHEHADPAQLLGLLRTNPGQANHSRPAK